MEPILVRAARREPVERTPVWFMRQAGRSLPEYRALRERHSFWEVARTPELCAEVTLQPVRRHGVDAAVMFADIMTPVVAMGLDVELVEGVGPVLESPVRSASDRRAVDASRPGGRVRTARRGDPRRPRRACSRAGGRRLLRRPVHGRGLPRRGAAVARAHAREGADVRRAGRVECADGHARGLLHRLSRCAGPRGRGRRAALRLVGRRPLAGGLRGVRRAVVGTHPRERRGADDPFRHRHGDAAAGDGACRAAA